MTTRFSTTQAVSSRSLARKTRPLMDCSGRSKRGSPGEIGFRTTPIGSGSAIIRAFKLWCSDSGARKINSQIINGTSSFRELQGQPIRRQSSRLYSKAPARTGGESVAQFESPKCAKRYLLTISAFLAVRSFRTGWPQDADAHVVVGRSSFEKRGEHIEQDFNNHIVGFQFWPRRKSLQWFLVRARRVASPWQFSLNLQLQ